MKILIILFLFISCGKGGDSRYTNPIEKAHREVSVESLVVNPVIWSEEKVKFNAFFRKYSGGALLQDKNNTSTLEVETRYYNKYGTLINNNSAVRMFGRLKYDIVIGYYFEVDYYQTTGDIKQVSY